MSENIEKLSRIKKDIGIVQDSIFFELYKLDQEITRLKKALEIANRGLEKFEFYVPYNGDTWVQEKAREALKQIEEVMGDK